VPVEEIDVNVHPAKTEIRFRRTEAVKDVIAAAVRESLARAGIVAESEGEREVTAGGLEPDASGIATLAEPGPDSQMVAVAPGNEPPSVSSTPDTTGPVEYARGERAERDLQPLFAADEQVDTNLSMEFERAAEARAGQSPQAGDRGAGAISSPSEMSGGRGYETLPPINSAVKVAKAAEVENLSGKTIKPIAQLHESFIIAVDEEGLLLVDQHVAHERILFDKFRKRENDREVESQNLLLPETIDLSPAQAEAFQLIEGELASLGFGLMRLSGRTIAIKSVPADIHAAEARNLFAEILDAVDLDKRGSANWSLRDDIAASLACKAAVKINMLLSPEKMHWLIDRLLLTSSPTTCPHGRPVILRLTMKDIERGFHRT
jgi:DNA mismatch repair protein MutL